MRNKKQILILLIMLLPILSLFSYDPSSLNRVTFINKTGADIWYVFLSPGDSSEWGFDILGSERVLENNNLLSFYVFYPNYSDNFDIMAIDENGKTFVLYEKEFSDDEEITVLITSGDEEDNPGMEFIEVEFENQTDYEMLYLFVSPTDSEMWGVDMMDEEQTLYPYDTLSLLAPYDDETVSYDVMAVDEDMDEYQFTLNVNWDYTDDDGVLRIPIEMSDLSE
ncbi:hypothetical protein [Spirochaeta isovalerica]|uniref:Uncharacterized protein n=1 Tax=Spirochaeta isovalerica TaxID=150 RepID=A0A841RBE3_9SPIO|nr:hypothetical protein [Spirochaeta isovalerica]MBB6481253.1 hypothetical protein [Spirochaeta isovalerica]